MSDVYGKPCLDALATEKAAVHKLVEEANAKFDREIECLIKTVREEYPDDEVLRLQKELSGVRRQRLFSVIDYSVHKVLSEKTEKFLNEQIKVLEGLVKVRYGKGDI